METNPRKLWEHKEPGVTEFGFACPPPPYQTPKCSDEQVRLHRLCRIVKIAKKRVNSSLGKNCRPKRYVYFSPRANFYEIRKYRQDRQSVSFANSVQNSQIASQLPDWIWLIALLANRLRTGFRGGTWLGFPGKSPGTVGQCRAQCRPDYCRDFLAIL